jgi:hypothetical protein
LAAGAAGDRKTTLEDSIMAKITSLIVALASCVGLSFLGFQQPSAARGPNSGVQQAQPATSLRAEGPGALDDLLITYDRNQAKLVELQTEMDRLNADGHEKNKDAILALEAEIKLVDGRMARLRETMDQVGGQRGCAVSRLYWYTDLEAAKAESARRGRPILSLRMLGKLTDEYSCANSRFFRTALYSNKDVSDFMRTNFVLHWQSVRPVPKVTIDFGDGRKLERTLTGNSAHHVLASDGTPLDVLPGLYSPLAFRQWLWTGAHFASKYEKAPLADRGMLLQAFHAYQRDELLKRWDMDIQRLGSVKADYVSTRINGAIESARLAGEAAPAAIPPKAVAAAKVAVGKSAAEAPMLRFANLGGTWMERGMDEELWQAVANLHREDVKLDEASVAVVRKEFPAAVAMRATESKRKQEDPVLRLVRSFEDSMTLDTVRNEYLLHRKIHERFAAGDAVVADVNQLNEWVYAELFLTPSSDPWLGLAPNDVYTALEQDGRTEPARGAGNAGG